MPSLRVKVEGTGQPATRVELPADAAYQQGLATVLGAVGLETGQGLLSLNNKEPVNLGPQERMFQGEGFRPGDLVWVVVSDSASVPAQNPQQAPAVAGCSDSAMTDTTTPETAPVTQAQHIRQHSEQHVPTMDAGPAFTAACAAIKTQKTAASAAAICRCIVHSCFLDSGCTPKNCQDSPEQQAEAALLSTSGYFQTEFTFPAISPNQPVKLVIFPMGHQQIVYTSLPGSGLSQRQLVFEDERFEGSAALSVAVVSSTYSAVRDRLFTWAVNACLLKAGKQQGLGLMALPGEALLQIVANLPFGDVAVTASVCKRLSTAAADDSVWKQVYEQEFVKEFPDGEEPIPAFRTELAERNRLRAALNRQHRPGGYRGPQPPGLYMPPYRNVPTPGIVGGDYDRLPGRIWLGGGAQWITGTAPSPAGIPRGGTSLFGGGGPFGGMGRAQGNRGGAGGRRFI